MGRRRRRCRRLALLRNLPPKLGAVLAQTRRGARRRPERRLRAARRARGADRAALHTRFDDEAPIEQLFVLSQLVDRLQATRDAAQLRQRVEERPALDRGQLPRRPGAHLRHIPRVAPAVRDQVLARALIGQIEQRHRLRPVVPVAEAQIDPAAARLKQRSRLAALPPARRTARVAARVVDVRDRPRLAGDRQRLQLRDIDQLGLSAPALTLATPQQCGRRCHETRQTAHVARLARGQRQRRLVRVGINVRPAAPRRRRQIVPARARQLGRQPMRRNREMHRIGPQRAAVGRRRCGRDQQIRPADRPRQLRRILRAEGALAPVRVGVQRRTLRARPIVQKGRLRPQRMPRRRLNQHHIRPIVREQPRRPRAGEPIGEIHNPQSVKRRVHPTTLSPPASSQGARRGARSRSALQARACSHSRHTRPAAATSPSPAPAQPPPTVPHHTLLLSPTLPPPHNHLKSPFTPPIHHPSPQFNPSPLPGGRLGGG